MRLPARGWAGLAAGLFVCAASAAQAQPMTLADDDLDRTTAGSFDDLFPADWLSFADLPDAAWDGSAHGNVGGPDSGAGHIAVTHVVTGDGTDVVTSRLVVTSAYSIDN